MAKKIKRLIKVTDLIEAINDELYMDESTKAAFRSIVYQQPLIDDAPVAHGRWEAVHDGWGRCPNCHRMDSIHEKATHCRFCGTKMDGGVSDA